mgnify:FL=1|jgi:hypothetical protein|tara:strand:+ start:169 stop:543 length:375 start_codon:yes stop_codon:yes gene_type:complete
MTFPTVYNPKRRGSRPKYGNKKVTVQGIKFDSKWESERYLYIKSLERAGRVRNLELQVRFNLLVNDQKICAYIADFRYEKENANGDWETIIEDAKGVETPEFKLKKKLMKACLGIEIFLSKKSY